MSTAKNSVFADLSEELFREVRQRNFDLFANIWIPRRDRTAEPLDEPGSDLVCERCGAKLQNDKT